MTFIINHFEYTKRVDNVKYAAIKNNWFCIRFKYFPESCYTDSCRFVSCILKKINKLFNLNTANKPLGMIKLKLYNLTINNSILTALHLMISLIKIT